MTRAVSSCKWGDIGMSFCGNHVNKKGGDYSLALPKDLYHELEAIPCAFLLAIKLDSNIRVSSRYQLHPPNMKMLTPLCLSETSLPASHEYGGLPFITQH